MYRAVNTEEVSPHYDDHKWSRDGNYIEIDAKKNDEIAALWPLTTYSHRSKVWNVTAPELEVVFHWKGNMVVAVEPPALKGNIPLFTGKVRVLPNPPQLD